MPKPAAAHRARRSAAGFRRHRDQVRAKMAGRTDGLRLLLWLLLAHPVASGPLGVGGGPVKCDVVSSCGAGATCCATPHGKAGEWGCCGAPNATCCPDMLHCCPPGFPVCGAAGTCSAVAHSSASAPWIVRTGRPASSDPHHIDAALGPQQLGLGLGRAPPPPPPPPLYPFECTATRIGCFAEQGRADGWANRTIARRNMVNESMGWGTPMSVTDCARFCYQGMNLVDWTAGASPFNVTLAGNHLCGCSAGLPPTANGLPKRVADSLCDAPCPANSSQNCGDEKQTVATAYSFVCTAVPAPLRQPMCNLNFSQWWNGSAVSYKQYLPTASNS